jgi:citrate synthase
MRAIGIPMPMFTPMFAIARTAGWLAQWKEMLEDPEQRISRPRQLYIGEPQREYLPMAKRVAHDKNQHPAGPLPGERAIVGS